MATAASWRTAARDRSLGGKLLATIAVAMRMGRLTRVSLLLLAPAVDDKHSIVVPRIARHIHVTVFQP